MLIDANALLLTDIPVGERFTVGIHMRNYSFDARNSSVESVRNAADQSSFVVSAHYVNPKATLPPPPRRRRPSPYPPFTTLPDGRSLFLGYTYNFAKLPDAMPARRADPRVGHFESTVWDFSSDAKYTAKTHFVNRWRLEKKDPAAALSEPKEPIVFWSTARCPRSTGPRCATASSSGTRRSSRSASRTPIVVKQQDADGDRRHLRRAPLDGALVRRHRRAVRDRPGEGRPAHRRDPERAGRDSRSRGRAATARSSRSRRRRPGRRSTRTRRRSASTAASARTRSDALAEMQFGLDLLVERGEIEPGSPEADAFVAATLKAVVMHEVGHTLGLRHNFRASTVYPLAKISDPAWSRENGISGSVMDYIPLNIAVKGEPQGAYVEPTIGPYDYWAIEYAYRPLPKETEADELAKIAARGATDPLLAYLVRRGSDRGPRPRRRASSTWAPTRSLYLSKRIVISQELWQRLQAKQLKPGESYDVLRRSFDAGFRQYGRAAALTAKYVGGVYYVRDYAGTARLPLTPVSPAKQRAALELIATGVFSADSFRFKPEFLRSMGINYLSMDGTGPASRFNPDFSLRGRVLALQTGVLNQLLSDAVLARLLDSEVKVSQPGDALTLNELFTALRVSIWSELKAGGSIPGPRRDLQREHLRRIATVLTRPSPGTPADAVALFREEAKQLSAQIKDRGEHGQPRRHHARAPRRVGGHARRGAEGAARAAGRLTCRRVARRAAAPRPGSASAARSRSRRSTTARSPTWPARSTRTCGRSRPRST